MKEVVEYSVAIATAHPWRGTPNKTYLKDGLWSFSYCQVLNDTLGAVHYSGSSRAEKVLRLVALSHGKLRSQIG